MLWQELSFIPITLRVNLALLLTLGNPTAPRASEKARSRVQPNTLYNNTLNTNKNYLPTSYHKSS